MHDTIVIYIVSEILDNSPSINDTNRIKELLVKLVHFTDFLQVSITLCFILFSKFGLFNYGSIHLAYNTVNRNLWSLILKMVFLLR